MSILPSSPLRDLNSAERKSVLQCLEWYMTRNRAEADRVRFYTRVEGIDIERVNHAVQYCLDELERAIAESFKELEHE